MNVRITALRQESNVVCTRMNIRLAMALKIHYMQLIQEASNDFMRAFPALTHGLLLTLYTYIEGHQPASVHIHIYRTYIYGRPWAYGGLDYSQKYRRTSAAMLIESPWASSKAQTQHISLVLSIHGLCQCKQGHWERSGQSAGLPLFPE